jgi:transcriptional regulator with XRE-family HTH domain
MNKTMQQTTGRRVAEARRAAGLTQGQLAERIGKTQSQVSDWERGRFSIDLETLWEIAQAIGCDPNALDPRLAPRTGARR